MNSLRPTFLTVLCILTFIGSGWGVINAITSYQSAEIAAGVTSEAMDEAMDQIEESADGEEMPDFVGKLMGSLTDSMTAENIRNSSMASGLAAILCLLGAFMMWQLNKNGYWIYLAGIAVTIFAPMVILGGLVGAAASGASAFVGVLFAVLYGINLKHMN
ncbi:hypothetical protein SAMN06298216_0572 [Spirosomataceae bacterium TFI 002]|nr:hypothetical protein SAMN06298216_0572 [Spirosomataceae bacterium TFI 002]